MKKIILPLLLLGVLFGQVNDKSFKEKISDGVVIVVFTSKWAESDGMEYVESVSGHEEAIIIKAMSENTKKICKKLRLRNFPSIALFINGDKADIWKADMDGMIDITPKDIKKAIDAGIAGDVF
jgi:hypothetical protein